MKIAVMGAGAMGCLYGGHLAKGGNEVWMVDVWEEHVNNLKSQGLLMSTGDNKEYVKLNATTDPKAVGTVDLLVIFTKGLHTEAAINNSLSMIGEGTYVLTLQNGIGNVDIINQVVDEKKILFGMTTLSSDLQGPGHIECTFHGRGLTQMKPLTSVSNPQIEKIVETFNQSGIYTELSFEVERKIWEKLIVNCCLNCVTAITRLHCGHVVEQESAKFLLEAVTKELVDVANAKGIPLEYDYALKHLTDVAWEAYNHYPSMVFDLKFKRKTEIDLISGSIIKEGQKHNIPTPVNATLLSLIKIIENNYDNQLF